MTIGWEPVHDVEDVSAPSNIAEGAGLDSTTCSDLELAAHSPVNVMVTACDGAQRAAWARTIHLRSARCDRSFVATCGCPLPGTHGGVSTCDIDDWFVRAAGGTLFIDRIGQLSAQAQALLVWRLTDQMYRAGDATMARRDAGVRIIAGSDRSLHADLSGGAFSEELFYRLNVIHIDRLSAGS